MTVWDLKEQEPVFVLQAHTAPITQIQWFEEKQLLMTCSKDKTIKLWKFPDIWVDEEGVE